MFTGSSLITAFVMFNGDNYLHFMFCLVSLATHFLSHDVSGRKLDKVLSCELESCFIIKVTSQNVIFPLPPCPCNHLDILKKKIVKL